ncbi:cytochrome P450 [Sphingomonas psychrotolerans]|uniref:Cytochrome P450 n=1 Tax=Sphingomonas psychrotolerans TaxID=1327635 RepID=A0ABU3N6I5_9SPHN|nr:cytochrome P450 [Sphingomonas psychrotolerans]MDT8760135.1 cytochrome P450 [Sphingomonas psychrotolerans]
MALPRAPEFDSTRAFFREGYDFVGNRCRALGTDAFRTRMMLRPAIFIAGEEAARHFYDGKSFTRAGAMPPTTLRLLQDKKSVQSLDGAAHAARKALFLDMMAPESIAAMGEAVDRHWQAMLPGWRAAGEVGFHDAFGELLTAAACDWAGLSLTAGERGARARELMAMIDGAGSAGPRTWRALLLRRRTEKWARMRLDALCGADATSPAGRIANAGLDRVTSGVELLNLLRPTVAVARFATFAALALHEHREAADWLRADPANRIEAFVQEVRRFYPFFPVIGGRVRDAFEWREHRFAPGSWVLLGLHATNHDSRIWGDPERFRPERFVGRRSSGFDLIPQGAGDYRTDHRCPGEWMTLEILRRTVTLLLATPHRLPEQDLRIPRDRFPTLPRSGLRLRFD